MMCSERKFLEILDLFLYRRFSGKTFVLLLQKNFGKFDVHFPSKFLANCVLQNNKLFAINFFSYSLIKTK